MTRVNSGEPRGILWEDVLKANSVTSLFLTFLRLGLTSFGGPVAHLGYFRDEFVTRKKWLSDRLYADLVALCQFLPGPASSQVGIAIGTMRAGLLGAFAAWLGFTLPSALVLVLFAYGVTAFGDVVNSGWLHGLKIVAVAVVAQAIWGMAKSLTPDAPRITLAVAAAVVLLIWPTSIAQIAVILAGGLVGWALLRAPQSDLPDHLEAPVSRKFAAASLIIFLLLLVGLPIAVIWLDSPALSLVDVFYRAGSLVFGGGHVVLPLLQAEVVPTGLVSQDLFLAGYGAAQAVPGPLFTFAGYLGAVMAPEPNGWLGALMALGAIFLPSFLLIWGALPFWGELRKISVIQNALLGINAAVVGLLIAAFYQPVFTSAVQSPIDFSMGLVAFTLLVFWKWPSWLVVIFGALAGELVSLV